MTKKSLILCVSLVLTLALGLGGTLAFLTDTDAKVNTFTMGNVNIKLEEDYEDDSTLMPGVEVTKAAGIRNVGTNDAYVFMTVAVPAVEDEAIVVPAFAAGYEDSWNELAALPIELEGENYLLYTFLYNDALEAGASTGNLLSAIKLDQHVDYNPIDGHYALVDGGVVTELTNALDAGKVYVNAFAIQTNGFDSAENAYDAYLGQWTADGKLSSKQILLPVVAEAPQPEPLPTPDAIVNSQEELTAAIADSANQVIHLGTPGTYTLPAMYNREITITGTADTVIDMTTAKNASGCDLTFQGVTLDYSAASTYVGLQHAANVTYKDCTINGRMFLYAPTESFDRCVFNTNGDYAIWTYSSKDVTFNDCTFNTTGKAILVYNEISAANFVANVNVNRCTFNDNGGIDGKAAVETGSIANNTATSNKYNLTFVDTTVNGFDMNNSTHVEFGNKNSMDHDHLNVVIDGVDVY